MKSGLGPPDEQAAVTTTVEELGKMPPAIRRDMCFKHPALEILHGSRYQLLNIPE